MGLRETLRGLWTGPAETVKLYQSNLRDFLDASHLTPEEYTLSDLKQLEADGDLVPGQSYDVIDFHPTYVLANGYFTETLPRKLRFFAKKTNEISNFGEMIDEDYRFEFDFTTNENYPQGRIVMIENSKNRSSILHNQKAWNGVEYHLNDLSLGGFNIGYGCENISFGSNCRDISIGKDCGNIIFLSECYGQSIGTACRSIKFGSNCSHQIIGTECLGQTFGNNCTGQILSPYCLFQSFGNSCGGQIFGYACSAQIFGSGCNGQVFESECRQQSFGNNCIGQNFGYGCNGQIFGDYANPCNFHGKIQDLNFTSATHVYQNKTCNIFLDDTGTPKLSYFEGINIRVVDPTS